MTGDPLHIFEAERPILTALAYRMLGERAAAEDVVQEAWLRWQRHAGAVGAPRAWLRQVTTRLAVDALRAARARRECYVGPWLPEPLVDGVDEADGAARLELAEACHLALLWAMERLAPEERAAFVLRRVFDADYAEIAATLGRSEAACRQMVSRAATRLREGRPRFAPDDAAVRAALERFASAAMAQDHAAVLAMLAPDVTAISDGGGKARAALRPLSGAAEVAQVILAVAARAGPVVPRPVRANGAPALAVLEGGAEDALYTVTLDAQGRIDWIYIMRNPDKLPRAAQAAKSSRP
jgi:RNA polymerase sigma-70 factor (ECF subfamily)